MRTSPELLTEILGVLGQISTKLDTITSKPDKGSTGVGTIALGTYLGGKGRGKEKEGGSIGDLANSVEKLNKELNKVNMVKLNKLINTISTYEKIPKESALSKKTANMASSAKDAAKALLLMGVAVITFITAIKVGRDMLGVSPYEVLGFIALTALTLAASMIIISGGDATGEWLSSKIMGKKQIGKITSDKNRNKGAIENAKQMGIALMFIAGGILGFSLSIVASAAILGTTVLGVTGFIFLTVVGLSLSMLALSALTSIGDRSMAGVGDGKGRSKNAIENAKNMGIAFMFLAGGVLLFTLSMVATGALLGVSPIIAPLAVAAMVSMLAASIVLLSLFTAGGNLLLGAKGKSSDAIQNAKNMGIAFMFIAGGVLAFSIVMALVPRILGIGAGAKNAEENRGMAWKAAGTISLMIIGFAAVFVLLGLKPVATAVMAGTATAGAIALGMVLISLGVLVVAFASKTIAGMMGKKETTTTTMEGTKETTIITKNRSLFAGLGMFGLFVLAAAGSMWLLGLPIVSGPILLGAGAMIGMSIALITTAKAIKKVDDTMKTMNVKSIRTNVKDMVSGVMGGVIEGIIGSGAMGTDERFSVKELIQFRRVTRAIKMLGNVATSLSKFAMGLTAFTKVGEVMDLVYDENGKPKTSGKSVSVKQVAKAIADTFGMFISSLVTNTDGLTVKHARALKKLGKALTGDRGIISGVNQFANTLKIFAEFGKENKIYAQTYGVDGMPIEGKKEGIPVTTIAQNIVNVFSKFIEALVSKSSVFEEAGDLGKKMKKVNQVLMGTKGVIGIGAKPGILSAITAFSDNLITYSEITADNRIPKKDKDGNIIPGEFIEVDKVIDNIMKGFTSFVTKFIAALDKPIGVGGSNLETMSKTLNKRIGGFAEVFTKLSDLTTSLTEIDRLSNSIGSLATNIGLLVTNMGNMNIENLEKLAKISAQHAVSTKGINISTTSGTGTSGPSKPYSFTDEELNTIGDKIGERIAAKLTSSGSNSGEFNFHFYRENEGTLSIGK